MRSKTSRVGPPPPRTARRVGAYTVAAFLLGSLVAGPALAATDTTSVAYVDESSVGGRCDDARSFAAAGSPATPWCTPAKAIAAAPAGSTVYLRRAAYSGVSTTPQVARSGYTTLRPYAGEESQVTIAGAVLANTSYLKLEGLTLTQTLVVDHGSHHVTVSRSKTKNVIIQDGVTDVLIEDSALTMTSGTSGVIFLSSSTTEPEIQRVTIRRNVVSGGHVSINARHFRTVLIEDNELKDVSRYGTTQHSDVIRTYAGGTGLTVRGNRLHDNEGNGFFIKDGKVYDVTLENNEITDTIGTGFKASLIYDVDGLRIVNNTFAGSFTFSGTVTGVTLANNILGSFNELGQASYAYKNYNLVGGGIHGPLASREVEGIPTFVDPAARDYRLASGSLGIDAGVSDFPDGTSAPATDRLTRGRTDDPAVSNTGGGLTTYYEIGALEGREVAPIPGEEAEAPPIVDIQPPEYEDGLSESPGTAPPPSGDSPAPPRRAERPSPKRPFSVRMRQTQRVSGQRSLLVSVLCPSRCGLKASARIALPGSDRSIAPRAARSALSKPGTATLRIRFSKHQIRRLGTLLRRHHRLRASVTVIGSYGTGPAHSLKGRVSLRR